MSTVAGKRALPSAAVVAGYNAVPNVLWSGLALVPLVLGCYQYVGYNLYPIWLQQYLRLRLGHGGLASEGERARGSGPSRHGRPGLPNVCSKRPAALISPLFLPNGLF